MVKIWTDGGGNTGSTCACAYVMELENGDRVEDAKLLPHCVTNNEAEYEGVIWAIESALILNYSKVVIYTDSKLVVNQIYGFYRTNRLQLQEYLSKVNRLITKFDSFNIEWIPREHNKRADKLCRNIIKDSY